MNWRIKILWSSITLMVLSMGLAAQPIKLNAIGGFEGTMPSFWNVGNQPGNSTLTWATDQSRSMGHSLKITKTVTTDTASWVSDNMCDIWSPTISKNVDVLVGAYVKTSGVNINPSTDDQKWYIAYTFYDSAGVKIGQTKLPINQSVATSTGWVADTNAAGQTVLPKDAWKLIISFVGGKNATGTVWADDFMQYGRGGAWAGQDWNTNLGVPTGWYYWLPPNGGNDGLLANGFENTVVTSEASHTGLYSLKFNMPANRAPHDGFVGTKRIPLGNNIVAGDIVRLSVWIKASNLLPDSAAKYPGTWAVGFTPLWFAKYGNNDGYNNVGPGNDYTFTFPKVTSFDWTQYTLDVQVPTGVGVAALETRLHIYGTFTGTVYFDDLTVEKVGTTTKVTRIDPSLPKTFELSNNYPNPFNPSTRIQFALPHDGNFSIVIYNVLGQQIRTLAEGYKSAGRYEIEWDGRGESGKTVESGVYFYRFQAGSTSIVKKMLMLK
jgi:hypothetical protein